MPSPRSADWSVRPDVCVADHPAPRLQISALSGLVGSAGQELRLANFEEFDDLMMNSDAPLVL